MGFSDSKGKRRKREGEVRHHQSFIRGSVKFIIV